MPNKPEEPLVVSPRIREMFRAKSLEPALDSAELSKLNGEKLKQLRSVSPGSVADLLQAHPNIEEELSPVTRPQAAAIILMSLPPAHSTLLFSKLEPELMLSVTKVIGGLPEVDSGLRSAVLCHFLFGVSRTVGESLSSACDELETLVRTERDALACHFRTHYLGSPRAWLDFDDKQAALEG